MQKLFVRCVVLAATVWCLLPTDPAMGQGMIIGYYPMWSRSSLPPSALRLNYLTHVNHAFAWPNADGSIGSYDATPDTELINTVHHAGRKILISLGGAAESGFFPSVVADSMKRHAFVAAVVNHVATWGYDGADFDWEGPANNTDKANEVAMMQEMRAAFDAVNSTWLLTMAVGVGDWSGRWRDFAALLPLVDWFNAMTYEFHGSWTNHAGHNAPLYAPPTDYDGSADEGIQYLHVTRAIPAAKLLLGLPFFGKEFVASGMYKPQTGVTYTGYADAVYRMNHNWTYTWDTVSEVPYLLAPSGTRVVTFDDSASLSIKCQYAQAHGLGGVMMWALGEDLTAGGQPLMEAVGLATAHEMSAGAPKGLVNDLVLEEAFPNPFNPVTTIGYRVPVDGAVRIAVYDILGREVARLVDGIVRRGGHRVMWDAGGLSSGPYFVRLQRANRIVTEKLMLLR